MNINNGALVLEAKDFKNYKVFRGELCGASFSENNFLDPHSTVKDKGFGEIVFNTSMTGYQEILTDPSYYGQMITFTYPHIGNTGINEEDIESKKLWCAGAIFNDLSEENSQWRSQKTLLSYLKENNIPAIKGVDTRSLTLYLRTQGVVRGILLPENLIEKAHFFLDQLPRFEGRDLVSEVSTKETYTWKPTQNTKFKIAVLDFGVKYNLIRELNARGCECVIFPANTKAEDLLKIEPDGVFLSNGPGDPSALPFAVDTVKKLIQIKIPIFGVCMGHQILSLALGGKTYKLKFGHRGGNQPVLHKGHVEISSHNHGYAVEASTLPPSVEITHINLNDRTVEGIRHLSQPAFSVQYHPEASPGPHDSKNLFDQFIELLLK